MHRMLPLFVVLSSLMSVSAQCVRIERECTALPKVLIFQHDQDLFTCSCKPSAWKIILWAVALFVFCGGGKKASEHFNQDRQSSREPVIIVQQPATVPVVENEDSRRQDKKPVEDKKPAEDKKSDPKAARMESLKELAQLKEQGILDDDEFKAEKAKILADDKV